MSIPPSIPFHHSIASDFMGWVNIFTVFEYKTVYKGNLDITKIKQWKATSLF